jgi:hypothetical protein
VATSTPLWPSGVFYELFTKARNDGNDAIAFQHSTGECNPTIGPDWLEEQRQLDPDAFETEFEARFSQAVSAYLSADAIRACVSVRGSGRRGACRLLLESK